MVNQRRHSLIIRGHEPRINTDSHRSKNQLLICENPWSSMAEIGVDMNVYDRIPNNVNLSEDKRLQRALEKWLPNFLSWWHDMGPEGFQEKDVWLRTAVDVGSEGWTHFDYLKMPDYRWGIFLEPAEPEAKIGFGDNFDALASQE